MNHSFRGQGFRNRTYAKTIVIFMISTLGNNRSEEEFAIGIKFLISSFLLLSLCSLSLVVSRAEMDIVRTNIDVLVSTGLGLRAEEDFLLARDTCVALLKLGQTHKVCELLLPTEL